GFYQNLYLTIDVSCLFFSNAYRGKKLYSLLLVGSVRSVLVPTRSPTTSVLEILMEIRSLTARNLEWLE
ncbi:hypothetical protein KYX90_13515, partial [Enterococcus lactis]|uniref:hypothetical protein n=1 Tax=Enterococcus lactis TaxID=357441 RepID=UPI001C7C9EEC